MKLRLTHMMILPFMLFSVLAHSDDPMQWLERMQRAAMEQNYRGTFVLLRDDSSSTQRIIHRYQNGLEQEKLIRLDGEMSEIVRVGNEVTCIFPDSRAVQLEPGSVPNVSPHGLAHAMPDARHYALSVIGRERMANRQCQVLRIEARDAFRYSYSFWLDQETGLLLKSIIHDLDGKVLERLQYTEIEFPSVIEDGELQAAQHHALQHKEVLSPPARDQQWPTQLTWRAGWVPPGFKVNRERSKLDQSMMVFHDGIAAFSTFIEPVSHDPMPDGASRVGAVTAYSQTLEHQGHRYVVTVVGEIPPQTAMKVAESIRPELAH